MFVFSDIGQITTDSIIEPNKQTNIVYCKTRFICCYLAEDILFFFSLSGTKLLFLLEKVCPVESQWSSAIVFCCEINKSKTQSCSTDMNIWIPFENNRNEGREV